MEIILVVILSAVSALMMWVLCSANDDFEDDEGDEMIEDK